MIEEKRTVSTKKCTVSTKKRTASTKKRTASTKKRTASTKAYSLYEKIWQYVSSKHFIGNYKEKKVICNSIFFKGS
jgi:hypothetical protein